MPTAIAQLVISTIVQEQRTSHNIVEHLRGDHRYQPRRADAIEKLDHMGWVLLRQPEAIQSDVEFVDIMAYWRKDFDSPEQAERELALAGAFENINFSLGWNYRGSNDENGMPDCEWWGEGPSSEYIVEHFEESA